MDCWPLKAVSWHSLLSLTYQNMFESLMFFLTIKLKTFNLSDHLWFAHLPYLTCAMSPTTISATGSCMTWPPRTTWNFCSCSMRLWSPRNCFSFDQSLKAVTRTTHTTDKSMAAPSIQPASASPSSSTPPAAAPHAAKQRWMQKLHIHNLITLLLYYTHNLWIAQISRYSDKWSLRSGCTTFIFFRK